MKRFLTILIITSLLVILIGANTNRVAAITQAISIGPDALVAGYQKQYDQQLTVEGGTEPYTFSLLSGNLPDGFTLSSEGMISGIADGERALPGTYPITIQVVDGNTETNTRDYDFVVNKGTPAIDIYATTAPYWNELLDFYAEVAVDTGLGFRYLLPGTIAFSVDDIPVSDCEAVPYTQFGYPCQDVSLGLDLGVHTVKLVYTPQDDSKYYSVEASKQFTIQSVPFSIAGSIFNDQNQNGIYDSDESAWGSGWTVNLDEDCDGTVDRTTTTSDFSGFYRFSSVPGPGQYCVSTQKRPGFQLTTVLPEIWLTEHIYNADIGYYYPTIIVSPETLPIAGLNQAYNQQLSASGGTEPYTFTITDGSLPEGLSLSEDGLLSGTPTEVASIWFELHVTDATGAVSISFPTLLVTTDGVFTFTSSVNPSILGDPVTFTVTATGDLIDEYWGQMPPFGEVDFLVDETPIEGCSYIPLNYLEGTIGDYPATCTTTALEVGAHQITANFYSYSDFYNIPILSLTQTVEYGDIAGLSIQSTMTQNQVKTATRLVYNFKISNSGPDAAKNLVLIDTLDSNTTYVSSSAPKGWSCGFSQTEVTCTAANLASGKTANINIVVFVMRTAKIGQNLVNDATVTSTTYDLDLANNSVTQMNMVRR